MIEWVHVGCVSGLRVFYCEGIRFVEHRSMHENRGAGCFDRLAHFRRRRLRYDDRHRNAERPSRISGGDPRIAAGGAEDLPCAVLDLVLAKPANTAKLEASRGLQRVELQPKRLVACAVVGGGAEKRRVEVERCRWHDGVR